MRGERLGGLAVGLMGCLDPILEGPYLLSTGLGACHSVALTGRERLLAGCSSGTWELDGTGATTLIDARPATAVSAHGDRVYMADEEGVRWRSPDGGGSVHDRFDIKGVVDIQAWFDGQVLLATSAGIQVWAPGWAAARPWSDVAGPAAAIGMGPDSSGRALLVVTGSDVWATDGARSWPVARGLVQPRAAMVDEDDTVWVVHGAPPVLARIEDGAPVTIARHLDDPTDLIGGDGGFFHRKNAYMSDNTGTVDYVRLP